MKENIIENKRFLLPILSLVIVSTVVISSINTYLNINIFEKHIQNDIENSKQEFLKKHTDDIKKQVEFVNDSIEYNMSKVEEQLEKELYMRINIARSICNFVYDTYKESLSQHEMRKMVASQLEQIRFDKENRGYYFAYQNSTRVVYEHIHKETIGTSMAHITDTKGVNVALAHDKALEGGKEVGLLKRFFYKPGNRKKGFPKLVAVTEFKSLDLLIGTGEYLDVIEKEIKKDVIDRFKNLEVNDNIFLVILKLHEINGGKDFATTLLNSNNPNFVGKKISSDTLDSKGIEYRKVYLKDIREKGYSYVDYWYKDNSQNREILEKAYVFLQKDWNWIIVSGFYFDNLEKQVKSLEKSLAEYTKSTIIDTIILISIIATIVIMIGIFVSFVIDNTIRRYTTQILKNKNELELAQKVAKMGSWVLDVNKNELVWSKQSYEIFEADLSKKDLTSSAFMDYVHPDDKELVEKNLQASINEQKSFYLVHRLKMKDGRIKIVEAKSEISFIKDDLGKDRAVFNGTVQDITEKKEQEEELKNKEQLLYEQERLASMGEMIGNIAHQWRQPLSIITTSATGMKLKKELGVLDDNDFSKTCDLINENGQYLSKTIDDFRNFIKGDREKVRFKVKNNLESFLKLVESTQKNHNIKIIMKTHADIELYGHPNELTQCYINLFNNAKDAFNQYNIEERLFFINVKTEGEKTIIEFKDNAGGIPNEIIHKIFEPYFTTKHQSQGTGLGLHMIYKIIDEGMGGSIEVSNDEFIYNEKQYKGAKFQIALKL